MIELLISLCIIGILATLAIPQFLAFRMRSMQIEAKASAGAFHQSSVAFVAERNSYTDDLSQLAWRPTGQPRYLCGFASDEVPAASGLNDTAELAAAFPNAGFSTIAMLGPGRVPLTEDDLPDTAVATVSGYQFACVADLDGDATLDVWHISNTGSFVGATNDATN